MGKPKHRWTRWAGARGLSWALLPFNVGLEAPRFLLAVQGIFHGYFLGRGVRASKVLNPLKQPPPILDAQPFQDFIYVIKGDNMVKVGVSTNPRARCLALQTGSAYPLEIVFAAPVRNAYAVESLAHDLLGSTRIRISGEWFGCSSETAIAAIRRAADTVGVSLFKA
jgi:T5orf172 domain